MRCRSRTSARSTTTTTTGTPKPAGRGPAPPGALFIVFEGVEGAGKSTQIQLVAGALREIGVDPVVTREPGGTPAAEAIRAVALDDDLDLSPVAELLLMLAARSVFVRDVVRPALEAGRVVLADRYELSTFAYQGGGRGLPLDQIKQLNSMATGGLRPDLCVLLDLEVDRGRGRKGRRAADRIEGEALEFHERVAAAYRELAYKEPDVALIDGSSEIQRVFATVWEALSTRFPETFSP